MDIIQEIQNKYDGTVGSIRVIRQRLRRNGLTLQQWKQLKDYALGNYSGNTRNTKAEKQLSKYLAYAAKQKRLSADDIGRIMEIVRSENKLVRQG
ncbi:hypothetical protein BHU72_11890 [Desulfuribacillus stibiiarsenatis]|uniref:Uncharacterized protein n=1 Tax=Desulfuribacillus stibiiarsenatis TaxID=1390249 RepID=A0A1E5L7V3_9FIRM|nr:hypothetical protein [Desulfuribacillus stibiiarsenatis]OEH86230.1 hypothetical protein BHU72_11890 [Desulfuribacillus stibiiarsenatis]